LARPDATDADIMAAAATAQIHDHGAAGRVRHDRRRGRPALRRRTTTALHRPRRADGHAAARPRRGHSVRAFADPDSEAAIQHALAALTRGRTLLVIAHRLHTIAHTDRILVLDRGRIAEAGTHDELVAAGGTYARMWDAYHTASTLSPRFSMQRSEA
jgi:ATP-binding cassette subfamily B protein IrtA